MSTLPLLKALELTSAPPLVSFMLGNTQTISPPSKAPKPKLRLRQGLVLQFTQELSNLIQAGLPLFQALSIIHKQEQDKDLRKLLAFLLSRIYGGFSLSSSLAYYPRIFSDMYLGLIQVGESSGRLGQQLNYLLLHLKRVQKTQHMVQTALLYPFLVCLCMGMVSLLLVWYVVPRFEGILCQSFQGPLPLLTQGLIGLSRALHLHWQLFALGAALLIVVIQWGLKRNKNRFMAFLSRLPGIQSLLLKVHLARLTHTLATGLRSGLSLLKSLDLAKAALGLGPLGLACQEVQQSIQKGLSFSEALKRQGAFPLAFTSLAEIGEATGSLQSVLESLSSTYHEQAESHLKQLSILLEPTVIILLSFFVGLVVLGLFLPMLQLMQGL